MNHLIFFGLCDFLQGEPGGGSGGFDGDIYIGPPGPPGPRVS